MAAAKDLIDKADFECPGGIHAHSGVHQQAGAGADQRDEPFETAPGVSQGVMRGITGPSGPQTHAEELISLNTTVRPRSILPRCDETFTRMGKDMTDKQQNAAALQRPILRTKSNQKAEERRVQDALEDDEVREALKLLHARGKNRRDEVV